MSGAEPMDASVSGQIGGGAGGSATGPGGSPYTSDTGTTGFEDEPPLLQGKLSVFVSYSDVHLNTELGIDFGVIKENVSV